MRPSSLVLAPVLVVLLASSAHAASPPSGVKRVAKRAAAAPYVLPAPAPKDESLPALPPPPPAAAPAPLPPPSAPVQLEVLPAGGADRVVTAPAASRPDDVKPTGFVLQLGAGVLAPASAFVRGTATMGPGVSFDLRLGTYLSPHFGVLVGFRGSYAHSGGLCGDGCSKGYSYQAPVMLQFAQRDRTRGVYGEMGLGFGTTYGGSGDDFMLQLSTPVEFKSGIGYRLPAANDARRPATLDLNLAMDVGTMRNVKARAGGVSFEGSLDDAPTHVVIALSLISHFSL
jgi:hypothetical protein